MPTAVEQAEWCQWAALRERQEVANQSLDSLRRVMGEW
jgi:hypothetical protein